MNNSVVNSRDEGSWAYFAVDSQLPYLAIEQCMGIPSDGKYWSIGDAPRIAGVNPFQFSRWTLMSGVDKGEPLDTHLAALWRRLAELRERIIQLPDDMKRSVQCVASYGSHHDFVGISSGHFATAAYYRAKWDFDFYFDDGFGSESHSPYWAW